MRYLAKSEDGRIVGEGNTIKTAVNRARKRDGAYVVDDSTGMIQWRKPKPQAVKPSSLPWASIRVDLNDEKLGEDAYWIRVNEGRTLIASILAGGLSREEAEANAALIVRAVNAHAKLVDALQAFMRSPVVQGMRASIRDDAHRRLDINPISIAVDALRAAEEVETYPVERRDLLKNYPTLKEMTK